MNDFIKNTVCITLAIGVFYGFFWHVVPIAAERESARQEAVKQHNCAHYGDAINKHAGKELCPPTPQG